jgi:transcriptional regulator with XRE-family HTH domain
MLLCIVEQEQISIAFGQVVRDLRRQKGLSQEELADLCGLHRNAIGLLERGERAPLVETVFALSRGLGIKTSTIIAKLEA